MTKPRFLADEDLRGDIVRIVRRMEPALEITTIVEQALASLSDEDVLEYAWSYSWLVVSHDVNTMRAIAERRVRSGLGLHGLFLAPQSRSARIVADEIVLVWAASEFADWQNQIVYLPL